MLVKVCALLKILHGGVVEGVVKRLIKREAKPMLNVHFNTLLCQ